MYEHNALGYSWGLALCLTKVRSSRARCPVTALIRFCTLFLSFLQNLCNKSDINMNILKDTSFKVYFNVNTCM